MPKPPPRPKQMNIPGTLPPRIKELEKAADKYVEARDSRIALTEEEVASREALAALMHQHGLTSYRYDERIITLVPAEKVKVKKDKPEVDDDDGEKEPE